MGELTPMKNEEEGTLPEEDDYAGNWRSGFRCRRCPIDSCKKENFKRAMVWSWEGEERCRAYLAYHLMHSGQESHWKSKDDAVQLAMGADLEEFVQDFDEREQERQADRERVAERDTRDGRDGAPKGSKGAGKKGDKKGNKSHGRHRDRERSRSRQRGGDWHDDDGTEEPAHALQMMPVQSMKGMMKGLMLQQSMQDISASMQSTALALHRQNAYATVPMQNLRSLDEAMQRVQTSCAQSRRLCEQLANSFKDEHQVIEDCRDVIRNVARESGTPL
eukprot:TRINITY_DN35486_c0_g1_i1.p2 TRINITY_DN35486_c0_g1~~TRINITY_DN35486_c0_g1_i1.p2  ORF type:complete len:276 (+),score=82.21 TRINITY_DN35486_c0_g1_i1:79-906(+)